MDKEVEFLGVAGNKIYVSDNRSVYAFSNNGKDVSTDEWLLLPSKYQMDWSKFKAPEFNPKTFKPFDKVLIKQNYECERWTCDLFSHMLPDGQVFCAGSTVYECIPYNDETMHLLGTDEDAPEYYKWWEE